MANKRIKDLATTASSAASDDFMALDGVTNGTRKLSAANPSVTTLTTSGVITPGGSVHGANGSAANPSFAFNSDQNTGLYRIGTDNIGVAVGGVNVLDVASTGLTVTGGLGASSLTSPAGIDLTLAGGSSGASLVLGQGATASTLTSAGTNQWLLLNNTAASNGYAFRTARQGTTIGFYHTTASAAIGTVSNHPLDFLTFDGSTQMRLATTGNLLIGTTSETGLTGAGGLKIASTTAGSSGAGALVVAGGISAGNTGSAASYFGGAVTTASTLNVGANIEMPASSSIRFNSGTGLIYTGGYSYALSLQSSQLNLNTASNSPINTGTGLATFGGAVTATGNLTVGSANTNQLLTIQSATAGSGQGAVLVLKNNTTIIGYFGRSSYISSGAVNTDAPAIAGTTGLGINFFVNDSTNALALASTGAATFAGAVTVSGALKLGNAYVAGAVVGTGSITIQDSTGTTYRIPVLV